ncbi:hypothetical protein P7K49_037681 [Saguinus oedipus]|uniref:Uncharacterized protein n=1 Tax=Saguinus oedipus TaxID=9490 RepID=A0ABQ9TIR9_SAGOE|nr:hypothetical protein P7K49_037681 [Saguinus oedipus]
MRGIASSRLPLQNPPGAHISMSSSAQQKQADVFTSYYSILTDSEATSGYKKGKSKLSLAGGCPSSDFSMLIDNVHMSAGLLEIQPAHNISDDSYPPSFAFQPFSQPLTTTGNQTFRGDCILPQESYHGTDTGNNC